MAYVQRLSHADNYRARRVAPTIRVCALDVYRLRSRSSACLRPAAAMAKRRTHQATHRNPLLVPAHSSWPRQIPATARRPPSQSRPQAFPRPS